MLRSLLRIRNLLLKFSKAKQISVLHFTTKLFSSVFSSFVDSCPFCGRSDTEIGRGSSVASSRLFSRLCHLISLFPRFSLLFSFCFLMSFFILFFYLFSPFLSSLRFSNCVVFPHCLTISLLV